MEDKPPSQNSASAAARLRHAIDSGNTGEKVNYPDPAAAPLGTDEEAAGTPVSLTDEDVEAELVRSPRPQRSWIPENLGERSAKLVILAMVFALVLVSAWIIGGSDG